LLRMAWDQRMLGFSLGGACLPAWIADYQEFFWALGVLSVILFVGSLLVVPSLVIRIPSDYFNHQERPASAWAEQHRTIRFAALVTKNLLGAVLLAAGFAMLVLPGQGLLTLFVGVMLVSFPGKYRFEKWLVRKRWVHRPINWLRRKRKHEPLRVIAVDANGSSRGRKKPE